MESPAPAPAAQPPPAATAEDDDLREVVLRHLFQHNASGQQGSAGIYCIAVEGQADPSPALLARFSRHSPRVLPASACSADVGGVEEAAPAGGRGRGSVARGLLFRINRIQRIGPDRANVDGGYYEGGLSASGNSYVVVREGGRWFVKSERMNWISQRSVPTRRA